MRHACVELTVDTTPAVARLGVPIGAVLVDAAPPDWLPALRAAGASPLRIVRAGSDNPAAKARAYEQTGLSVYVAPTEHAAAQLRRHTPRPVVSTLSAATQHAWHSASPCAASVPAPHGHTVVYDQSVAVIVTSHNYGRYLGQCLDSILTQSQPPRCVIVVDDASGDDDDTRDVCARYPGVQYLRVEHRDVAFARNAGAELAGRPGYLLFVDADNWLPPHYIRDLLAGFAPENFLTAPPSPLGVTYAHLDHVDENGRPIGRSPAIRPYTLAALRAGNLADTCSLIRRQAFEQVGGWRSYRWGLHDWDLWLRITAGGWSMRLIDSTALHYRIHPTRMSAARDGHYECGMEVMRESQLTAIVTLFSGRTWMTERWFAALDALRWKRRNLHLVAIDNSRDATFGAALRERLAECGLTHTYIRDDRRIIETMSSADFTDDASSRMARTYAMSVHLARLYATASQYLPIGAANVWSIEDDVLIPPHALETLATELFRTRAGAVCGCLRNRFFDRDLIAYTAPHERVANPPATVQQLHATGFYCVFARRDAWDSIAWRAGETGEDRWPYYDWAACADILHAGHKIYLVGGVHCRHCLRDGRVLDV